MIINIYKCICPHCQIKLIVECPKWNCVGICISCKKQIEFEYSKQEKVNTYNLIAINEEKYFKKLFEDTKTIITIDEE